MIDPMRAQLPSQSHHPEDPRSSLVSATIAEETCHKGGDCRKKASDKAAGVDTRKKDKGASNLEGQDDDDDDDLGNMELHSDDEQGLTAVGCEDHDDSDDDEGDENFEAQFESYIEDVKQRR